LNQRSASGLEKASKLAITKLVVFKAVKEHLQAIGETPDDKMIASLVEKIPRAEFAKLQNSRQKTAFRKQLEQVMATVLCEYSKQTGVSLDR